MGVVNGCCNKDVEKPVRRKLPIKTNLQIVIPKEEVRLATKIKETNTSHHATNIRAKSTRKTKEIKWNSTNLEEYEYNDVMRKMMGDDL